jgi:hypothetical protein
VYVYIKGILPFQKVTHLSGSVQLFQD